MPLTRRKTLALIGGGTVLAATVTAAGFVTTRTPTDALRPWSLAGGYDDPRLNALSYALLAPNPHNLQPWKASLEGQDRVRLWRDTDKGLPHTDPFDRQIMIGLGCFLEQMVLAASALGQAVDLTLFPEGIEGPVAQARFGPGVSADPLVAQIRERRSCKEPFEDRPVDPALIAALAPFADIHADAQDVARIRKLTWEALMVEMNTPRTMQESVELMRFGKDEINANPDGIDLGGPFLEGLMLVGLLRREVQGDPESAGFKEGLKMYRKMLLATPAYAVLTTAQNAPVDQIDAGRRWLRLNLKTTALGLALHPVSQALQEYPEMATHYDTAHQMLAPEGHTVQMLGRLGYGPRTPRTPRWPLEAKLIDT